MIQILLGSFFSPHTQFKARMFLKTSNMDFLPNLIKQGKFIDTVSGLTIFINKKTNTNTFQNIFIQEGEFNNFNQSNDQIIYAKEGYLVNANKKLFRLIDGKIISTNNNRLISFQFDKIDYDLSQFTSRSIKRPKIQELSSLKLINCAYSLLTNRKYIDAEDMFNCEERRLKNINQELYKRLIKPIFLPLLTLLCCFLLTISKEQDGYTFKLIKIFLFIFIVLVMSEILMRYIETSKIVLVLFMLAPILFFLIIYNLLIYKVRHD